MKKVVALMGDHYHKEAWSREALEAALKSEIENKDIELIYTSHDQLADELLKQPDGVILFKENRLNPTDAEVNLWMDKGTASQITKYVSNGGGWLAWHSGLASYDVDGEYIKMLRGHFEYHPQEHQQVTYSSVDHQLGLAGQADYAILDEHYFVQCDEANTEVFLRSTSVDGESIAGWAHPHGKGRVCSFAPAHNREGLLHDETLNLLKQSILWCIDSQD